MKEAVFKQCQALFPDWQARSVDDFEFDDPKGFSSFTMGVRSKLATDPPAVLYRKLAGKENAILAFEQEKDVFLTLGNNDIAAHCYFYDESSRVEAFYQGRSLTAEDLFEPENLRKIAAQLHRFHQLRPSSLPDTPFFELLHQHWGKLARKVLWDQADQFPANEQAMCEDLKEIVSEETFAKVQHCLPQDELTFCHNDTYHGNIMLLDNGDIKLVDFEFSCLNNKAYDFSNLFAETVMEHKQPEYPYFKIAEPRFTDNELGILINYYLDHEQFASPDLRTAEFDKLLANTRRLLMLSDYKYAMAAIPLAVEPIQKIRFIPYAWQRFKKFLTSYEQMLEEAQYQSHQTGDNNE
ncbi:MAG: phosphotransferase [Pseudomonadota bacterium]